MRLSTKLFLLFSALVLVICAGIYIVPDYIVETHAAEDRERFINELVSERVDDQQHYLAWLRDEIRAMEGVVDAFLYLVVGHSRIQQGLLKGDELTSNVWLAASHLMTYSDQIDFLQMSQEEDIAALTLSRSTLYIARREDVSDSLAWIELASLPAPHNKKMFIGIWLPTSGLNAATEEDDEPHIPRVYLMYDPEVVLLAGDTYQKLYDAYQTKLAAKDSIGVEEQVTLAQLKHLAKAHDYLSKTFDNDPQKLAKRLTQFDSDFPPEAKGEKFPPYLEEFLTTTAKAPTSFLHMGSLQMEGGSMPNLVGEQQAFFTHFLDEVRRTNELEMMSALGGLAAIGEVYTSPFEKGAPVGAARLVPSMNLGTAVLSRQVFSDKSLFPGRSHFLKYPPVDKRFPIASQFGLASANDVGAVTLTNVVQIDKEAGAYLALGASMNRVMNSLAEISGETILMVHKGKVVNEIGPALTENDPAVWRDLERSIDAIGDSGFASFGGVEFYYALYEPDPAWDFSLIALVPAEKLFAPARKFEARSRLLTNKISRQIIAVAIGVFVAGLLLVELITRHFTRPISHLAIAAEKVAEGKLNEVELPDVSEKSRNEMAILTRSFSKMVTGLRDKERFRSALDKVVSKEVAEEILKGNVHLGGETRDVTVMFADIRSFTRQSETLTPEQTIEFVNDTMTLATNVIESNLGVIDKYIGDAVMALFGAPLSHRYSPLQAVLAAIEIRKQLIDWNLQRAKEDLFAIELGTGIHHGPMLVGNMGAEDRLNYTVVGANVNLASRLCEIAKPREILVVEEFAQIPQVKEFIQFEDYMEIQLKGIEKPKHVFQVVGIKEGVDLDKLDHKIHLFGTETVSTEE